MPLIALSACAIWHQGWDKKAEESAFKKISWSLKKYIYIYTLYIVCKLLPLMMVITNMTPKLNRCFPFLARHLFFKHIQIHNSIWKTTLRYSFFLGIVWVRGRDKTRRTESADVSIALQAACEYTACRSRVSSYFTRAAHVGSIYCNVVTG